MEVAIMGPNAFPVNLAEFKKPITLPFGSSTNKEMMSGSVAAINPV